MFTNREGREQVATAMVAGAILIAGQKFGMRPETQNAVALMSSVLGLGLGRWYDYLVGERLPSFWASYTAAHGGEQAVADHHEQHQDDPAYHETVFRGFRAMVDAADPSVIEPLGRLTGTYTREGKKPDPFFRGFGRMLCELEVGELEQLTSILKGAKRVNDGAPEPWARIVIDSSPLPVDKQAAPVKTGSGETREIEYEDIVRFVHSSRCYSDLGKYSAALRLFMLLKREGLAENVPPVEDGRVEQSFPVGDLAMLISAETLDRILDVSARPEP